MIGSVRRVMDKFLTRTAVGRLTNLSTRLRIKTKQQMKVSGSLHLRLGGD